MDRTASEKRSCLSCAAVSCKFTDQNLIEDVNAERGGKGEG